MDSKHRLFRLAIVGFFFGLGCDQHTHITPPLAEPNERSALVAVHDGHEDFSLYATPLSDLVRFLIHHEDEARVEWLFFSQTLEELALDPGLVPLPRPGESGRPIPTWSRAFETTSMDETAEWTPVSAISDEFKELELPGEGCSGLDHANARLVDIGAHGEGRLLAVIDANRLLVSAVAPIANYIVHKDGRIEAISLGAELDRSSPSRAAVEQEGVLWLVNHTRGVYRVSFGPSTVVEGTPAFPEAARSIAVELDTNDQPVVHVGSERSLYRLDGTTWSLLQTFGRPEKLDVLIATNGPDHVVMSTESSSVSVHFTPSGRFEVLYPISARQTVLSFEEPFGLLLGTQESNLWRFYPESKEWSVLTEFGLSDVSRIVQSPGGVVVGFALSPELAEYRIERGLCVLNQTPLLDTRHMVSWGDELVVLPERTVVSTGLRLLRIPMRR